MSKLTDVTNAWFLHMGSGDRPSAAERLKVFAALVTQLGPDIDETDLRKIHACFTYLLLDCNPVTGQPVPRLFSTADNEVSILNSDTRRMFERMLDFTQPNNLSAKWNLLLKFTRIDPSVLVRQVTDGLSEQRAYMTLALVLIAKPVLPTTLLFVRECLNLYKRHLSFRVATTSKAEFCTSTPMFYAPWLKSSIDDAFRIGTMSNRRAFATISYMAWFANLIRVNRMLQADVEDTDTAIAVSNILTEQVVDLNKVLDSAPLRIEDTATDQNLLDLFGVPTKKKAKQE